MKVTNLTEESATGKQICNVIIIYDDAATRQHAMSTCDFLIQELWSDVEFDFQWWRTDFLEHAVMARAAAEQAAAADFLIVACRTENDLSFALRAWFESWIEERQGRDGALLSLTTTNPSRAGSAERAEQFLRGIAQRAMLDYFETKTETATTTLPSSFEDAERRANQISSVLDEILNQHPRPPSFGLND